MSCPNPPLILSAPNAGRGTWCLASLSPLLWRLTALTTGTLAGDTRPPSSWGPRYGPTPPPRHTSWTCWLSTEAGRTGRFVMWNPPAFFFFYSQWIKILKFFYHVKNNFLWIIYNFILVIKFHLLVQWKYSLIHWIILVVAYNKYVPSNHHLYVKKNRLFLGGLSIRGFTLILWKFNWKSFLFLL